MNKFQKEIEAVLTKEAKASRKKLAKAYNDSLHEIKERLKDYMVMDSYRDLTVNEKLQVDRLIGISKQIEGELVKLQAVQEDLFLEYLQTTGHIAYSELFYQFESETGMRVKFSLMSEKTLENIINTPIKNIKLSSRLNDGVIASLKANLQAELFRGIAQGIGYKEMARRLSEVGKSSYKRALNIMRTEGGRVQSISRQQSQEEAKELGIEFEKEWVSTLDVSTRDSHANLDGQRVGVDEYFKTKDGNKAKQPHMFGVAKEDINCRCRTISIVKGYEPAVRRDNITKEIIPYQNYQEWYKANYAKFPEYKSMGLM